MMKKVYSCNLCGVQLSADKMIGVYFTNLEDFHFDLANSTDGTHICKKCIPQLHSEIVKMKNPSIGEL